MIRALCLAIVMWLMPIVADAVSDPSEMLTNPRLEARAEAIGEQLRCMVCQNESIEASGAPLARDLRHIVRTQVTAGRSNRQIMAWMVARYGNFVRLRPPFDAATLLLWGMPLLALAVGGLAAWIGWRSRGPHETQALSESERRRLDELLEPH